MNRQIRSKCLKSRIDFYTMILVTNYLSRLKTKIESRKIWSALLKFAGKIKYTTKARCTKAKT